MFIIFTKENIYKLLNSYLDMNKNPERPNNMNEVMSKVSNPNYKKPLTKMEKYWETQARIIKEIFGEEF